jgi:hypothetical protein
MAVLTISALKAGMQVGVPGDISASDIHNIVDTFEFRTNQVVSSKSGNYAAVLADDWSVILFTAAATLTIPNSLPQGWQCSIIQMGTGQVTVSAYGSPPLSRSSHTKTAGQYAMASIFVATNTSGTNAAVLLAGDTAT